MASRIIHQLSRASRLARQPIRNIAVPLSHSHQQPIQRASIRLFTSSRPFLDAVEAPDYLDEGERKVFELVKESLNPTSLEVQDVSGGCGSMYALDIVSDKFKGLSVIKQHRLVNQVLGEEIKKWHGVQLKTKAP